MFKSIKNIQLNGDVLKFDDIDLSPLNITPKFVCIAGENGTGKTTLIKWIKKTRLIDQIKLNNNNSFFILHTDINGKIRTDYQSSEFVTLDKAVHNVMFGDEEKMIDGVPVNREYLIGRNIIDICKKIKDETYDSLNTLCLEEGKNYQTEIQNTFLMKFQNLINSNLLKDIKIDLFNSKWFNNEYDIDNVSSGEQQIILIALKIFDKLFSLSKSNKLSSIQCVYIFIDEIEAYLHPLWRYKIISFIKKVIELFTHNYQLTFTTHSTEVIDYILTSNETSDSSVVIQLKKDGHVIHNSNFSKNDCLIGGTSEINHIIFNIPTPEYFICLYEYIRSLKNYSYLLMDQEIIKKGDITIIKIDPDQQNKHNMKKYKGEQTYISRMRHMIAHGFQQEHNYEWYLNEIKIPNSNVKNHQDTLNFYENWKDKEKRMELLNSGIQKLKQLI